jgi:hypothetical protein
VTHVMGQEKEPAFRPSITAERNAAQPKLPSFPTSFFILRRLLFPLSLSPLICSCRFVLSGMQIRFPPFRSSPAVPVTDRPGFS